jgi:uncharacterized protein YkuJ
MFRILAALLLTISLANMNEAFSAEKENRVFEIRIVTAAPGKFNALNQRFKNHVVKTYEKHGATTIGYFVPVDSKVEKVVYILAFKTIDDRNDCMTKMAKDEDWKKTLAESEKNGTLVKDVKYSIVIANDFSPIVKTTAEVSKSVFELRVYKATKGNLPALHDRFRDHTVKLFEKHGMTNLGYWTVADMPTWPANPYSREDNLVYMLAHDSVDAAKKSFDAFRVDPMWVKAKAESEKKAGGSLTTDKDGVVSEFFKPAEYSPKKASK